MSKSPSYHSYPGIGEWGKDNLHYSQAVRLGDVIQTSGQGGWNPTKTDVIIPSSLAEEVDRAFENLHLALTTAGGKGFSQVYRLRSYHMDLDEAAQEAMVRNMRKWMPDHQPIYTQIGVDKLAVPGMRVEIEAWAFVGK
ncbi:hypothetical protein I302_106415 [Kwoniella bestiolae CBS 10118]|uniref:Uncharacterized protein n=1 Tax=Kwoniella bestiolae CBS 10118 TaxID=1296100 RepID=A0A1B9G1H7_9TREE|nr:hypothetical protein I302_06327 [Kwoniella bestiolae CBS 10118]OCF24866.1 hypothetical protein I302_06327 [Kwoniella bestiolae CBS 10118]